MDKVIHINISFHLLVTYMVKWTRLYTSTSVVIY